MNNPFQQPPSAPPYIREKDIIADKLVLDPEGKSVEIYGRDTDGNSTWIWIHLGPHFELHCYPTHSKSEKV